MNTNWLGIKKNTYKCKLCKDEYKLYTGYNWIGCWKCQYGPISKSEWI